MVGLLKFFLILTVIFYAYRFISPLIFKYLLNQVSKKMQNFDAEPLSNSKKERKKPKEEVGEYIDYDEIE